MELEKSDYYELSEMERIQQMGIEAEEWQENVNYSRPLSEDEIKDKNAEINQAIASIERIKDEIKDKNAEKKVQTDIIMKRHNEVISKSVQMTGKLWKVINTASGFIETINHEGYIIEKNRIKSGSMVNMFKAAKTAM